MTTRLLPQLDGLDVLVGDFADRRLSRRAKRKARVLRGPHGSLQFRFLLSEDETDDQSKLNEHYAYLDRMVTESVIPLALARRARIVWLLAWVTARERLPIPAAASFTGGPVEYYWEVGPHQLSAEIPLEGLCHWFYRNKTTGEIWGADVPARVELPTRLSHYLERLAASIR